MGEINWTDAQRAAIDEVDCSVLVSAGAGSGKTAVLAERCAALVASKKRPCAVDRLLVVTFTDAAAAEMRTRIAAALRGRLERDPAQSWLRRQIALIDSAPISTLHSFCRRLLEKFFAQAQIDPQSPILDPADAKLMRQEAIQVVFDDYEAREDAAGTAFMDFLSAYGGSWEQTLMSLIQQLDEFLASIPDSESWIAEALGRHDTANGELPPFWLNHLHATIRGELESQRGLMDDHIRTVAARGTITAKSLACLEEYAAALDGWHAELSASTLDEVCISGIGQFKMPNAPSFTAKIKSLPEDEQKAFKESADLVRMVKEQLFQKRLQKPYGRFSIKDWADGIARTRPHVEMLIDLTRAYRERYQTAKADLGVMDFADLERHTLRLLADESNGVAARLRDQFDYVLVDEFQDINPVQAEILRLISRETVAGRPWNLFTVGDVKQSIYRFRLAEPQLFLDRKTRFERDDRARASDRGVAIDLAENFRSRPILLEAVNAIFERLMTPELGGIAYDASNKLKPGRPDSDFRPSSSPPLELHILEDTSRSSTTEGENSSRDADDDPKDTETADLARIEREAYVCAERIRACIADGYDYGDIVILLRSMEARAGLFIRTLSRLGIPVFSDTSGGLFESLEANDVLALLAIMDNPLQDIPLAAILRSPLFGEPLTDSDLVEIRTSHPGHVSEVTFSDAVWQYASDGRNESLRARLAAIKAQTSDWRDRARRHPIADVLWQIYEDTGYLAYVSGLRDGLQRRANVLRLHEYARQFGAFRRQGLLRFLQFIDGVRALGEDLEPGAVLPGADDVVRVMTIHRSKGLEFPVVIVGELGKRFNLGDARGSILFDRALGIGMETVDLANRVRYESLPHQMAAESIKHQSLAEELRVLYVALTRAKERLILVGTKKLKDVTEWRERLAVHRGPLAITDRLSASGAIDWVVLALACQPTAWEPPDKADAAHLAHITTYDAGQMSKWKLDPPIKKESAEVLESCARLEPLPAPPPDNETKSLIDLLDRRLSQPYAASPLTRIPAVAAASVLKRRWDQQADADEPVADWQPDAKKPTGDILAARLRLPSFAAASQPIDQTLRGTWTHEFLQRIDLARPCDDADLAVQRDTLIKSGALAADEASQIDLAPLAWFFTTDLGRRLRATSTIIHREWPFVVGVDPARYDPAARAADPQDIMLIRGIVDVLFDAGDGWEILDYKTDRVSGEGIAARAALYAGQLRIYAHAVEMTLGKPVKRLHLAFLAPRQVIEVSKK